MNKKEATNEILEILRMHLTETDRGSYIPQHHISSITHKIWNLISLVIEEEKEVF